ncbi:hypothetical protein Xen7305DRAFT_00018300, partial [Xenococcus sp. PCC 7305]
CSEMNLALPIALYDIEAGVSENIPKYSDFFRQERTEKI